MNLTQKLAITAIGVLSLNLLQANSAKAATVTYDISGSNPSGFFSFDDSETNTNNSSTFSTNLTDFNFQIGNLTYTLSDVNSLGGRFGQALVYFNGKFNPSIGQYQPDLTSVGLTVTAGKNGTSVLINPVITGYFNNLSNYQSSGASQTSSGVISYSPRQVPEPDFTAGSAAGLGIVAFGWLKKKGWRIFASSI